MCFIDAASECLPTLTHTHKHTHTHCTVHQTDSWMFVSPTNKYLSLISHFSTFSLWPLFFCSSSLSLSLRRFLPLTYSHSPSHWPFQSTHSLKSTLRYNESLYFYHQWSSEGIKRPKRLAVLMSRSLHWATQDPSLSLFLSLTCFLYSSPGRSLSLSLSLFFSPPLSPFFLPLKNPDGPQLLLF